MFSNPARFMFLVTGAFTYPGHAADRYSETTVLEPIVVTDSVAEQTSAGPVNGYRALSSDGATRTRTLVEEIPQSISVLPRSVLDDQQVTSISEGLRNASGVVTNNKLSTPAFDTTRIRGFRAEQMLDGFTQYYNLADRESTIGVERLEVLKGANGVLYGGGSGTPVGGVVNLVSKRPEVDRFGEVGVKLGSHQFVQPFFDLNQPLSDNVLLRINGEYTSSESHVDVVETDRYNINPAITFTDRENTQLTLLGKFSRWSQAEYQGLPATGTISGGFRLDPEMFIGPANIPDSTSAFQSLTAIFEHRINETWRIDARARVAHSEFDEKAQNIVGADGFIADVPSVAPSTWALADAELFQEQNEKSMQLNAIAEFGSGDFVHTLLIGADYSKFEDKGFIDANLGVGSVDLAAPVFPSYSTPGPGVNQFFVDNETYGAYAQLQTTAYERLHLVAGLRAATVKVDYVNPAFGSTDSTDESRVLPRLGVVLDVNDMVSLFAGYSEGMRGQPFLNFVSSPEPEKSKQLEGGIKFNVADRLTGQLALYKIERSNVAVTDNTDPFFRSVADGKQRSHGFEADVVWQPAGPFSLLATYAYADAEFENALFGVPAGNTLPLVPEHSGRIWMNYKLSDVWSGGVGVYAQSATYLSNDNVFKSDGYHSVDAAISYRRGNVRIEATVKNLTDRDYFESYNYFGGRVVPSAGREFFVTAALSY